jgi:hypothetical protein
MLVNGNRYNVLFLHAYEILLRTPSIDLSLRILADPSTDLRRYNAPSVDEIAVLLPGDDTNTSNVSWCQSQYERGGPRVGLVFFLKGR